MGIVAILVRVGQETTPTKTGSFRLQILDEVQVGQVNDSELVGHLLGYSVVRVAVPALGGDPSDTSVQGTLSGAGLGRSEATSNWTP